MEEKNAFNGIRMFNITYSWVKKSSQGLITSLQSILIYPSRWAQVPEVVSPLRIQLNFATFYRNVKSASLLLLFVTLQTQGHIAVLNRAKLHLHLHAANVKCGYFCTTCGFHRGGYEKFYLLRYNVVYSVKMNRRFGEHIASIHMTSKKQPEAGSKQSFLHSLIVQKTELFNAISFNQETLII
jgi:hypothetical protein